MRKLLKPGDSLKLAQRANGEYIGQCDIREELGQGGFAICYAAAYEGRQGCLKEFYPMNLAEGDACLERNEKGQLVAKREKEYFRQMKKEFVRAYELLEEAKADDANAVLNNYLPPYQLLYGISDTEETDCATVYVWTPSDKCGLNFQEIIEQMQREPEKQPVHDLYYILMIMITLADCIRVFHTAGLLHLDIKPDNFLIPYTGSGDLNVHTISLYDLNTLYPIDASSPCAQGTKGFCAPEVFHGRPENRSDIYSIGAILFTAIAFTKHEHCRVYEEEWYGQLARMTADSPFIQAVESEAQLVLQTKLVSILKKCLAKRTRDRYINCEELIEDLRSASALLIPPLANETLAGMNKRLRLEDIKVRKGNITAMMQNFLYQHPLYEYSSEESSFLNVLILGNGTYAWRFLDVCLQTGQMRKKTLRITILSQNPKQDMENYLQFRPMLPEFANVTDQLWNTGENSLPEQEKEYYADIRFLSFFGNEKMQPDVEQEQKRLFAKMILDGAQHRLFDYIMSALDDDDMNLKTVRFIRKTMERGGYHCGIHYVWQSEEEPAYEEGIPLFVQAALTDTVDPELERMAFYTHLCWGDFYRLDLQVAKKEFRQKYNYNSSMAFAASIPYKLYSAGIEITDRKEAAEAFFQLKEKEEVMGQLAALEQRRWVFQMITEGWTVLERTGDSMPYEECIRLGSVKDVQGKRHPCLVRTSEKMDLQEAKYQKNHHAKWDAPVENGLDELDRMSIELHQTFAKYAAMPGAITDVRRQGDVILLGELLEREGSEAMTGAYGRLTDCLENIVRGKDAYVAQYKMHVQTLIDLLKNADNGMMEEAQTRLQGISRAYFPLMESLQYRDYKLINRRLIEWLPYILTAELSPALAVFLSDQRSDLPSNVFSASLLKPGNLLYLYILKDRTQILPLQQTLRAVTAYLEECGFTGSICLWIFTEIYLSVEEENGLIYQLNQSVKNRFEQIQIRPGGQNFQNADAEGALEKIREDKAFFADVTNAGEDAEYIRKRLREAGIPYFISSWREGTVWGESGCESFRYIKEQVNPTREAVLALYQTEIIQEDFPEFASEHAGLAALYGTKEQRQCWQGLCRKISASLSRQRILGTYLCGKDTKSRKRTMYRFPWYCCENLQQIAGQLRNAGVTENETAVVYAETADTCIFEIQTGWELEPVMTQLQRHLYRLPVGERIQAVSEKIGEQMQIVLQIEPMLIHRLPVSHEERKLLRRLQEHQYIVDLQETEEWVSFCFAGKRFLHLLTDERFVRQVCAYYEAAESGKYGYVTGPCIVRQGGTGEQREKDGLWIKGFEMIEAEL